VVLSQQSVRSPVQPDAGSVAKSGSLSFTHEPVLKMGVTTALATSPVTGLPLIVQLGVTLVTLDWHVKVQTTGSPKGNGLGGHTGAVHVPPTGLSCTLARLPASGDTTVTSP
jgi:hypothetical protein